MFHDVFITVCIFPIKENKISIQNEIYYSTYLINTSCKINKFVCIDQLGQVEMIVVNVNWLINFRTTYWMFRFPIISYDETPILLLILVDCKNMYQKFILPFQSRHLFVNQCFQGRCICVAKSSCVISRSSTAFSRCMFAEKHDFWSDKIHYSALFLFILQFTYIYYFVS